MEYTTTDPELELQSFAYFWERRKQFDISQIITDFLKKI